MPAHPGIASPNRGEWLRPKDVLLKLKAKKKALKARLDQKARQQHLVCTNSSGSSEKASQPRTNPFRCVGNGVRSTAVNPPASSPPPPASAALYLNNSEQSVDSTLFEILRSGVGDVRCVDHCSATKQHTPLVTSFTHALRGAGDCQTIAASGIANVAAQTHDAVAVTPAADHSQKSAEEEELRLGIDWQLYSHVRILSGTAFPWNQHLKTVEEASAVTSAARCLSDDAALDSAAGTRLHRLSFYWQHPRLPWLSLWPRRARVRHQPVPSAASATASASGTGGATTRSVFTDPSLQRALAADWCESLRSLFQLVRSRQCAFFYVCCARFTCLFRAAGVAGCTETHALLAPSTHGLRQLLKRDDVEFTMTLCGDEPAAASASTPTNSASLPTIDADTSQSPRDDADNIDDDEDDDDDEGAKRWLESMGIETGSMPGITSARRKLNSEMRAAAMTESASAAAAVSSSSGLPGVQGGDQSTLLVQGGSVHALLNFLLNARVCVSPTGPLAGVPPTLLAPVAFEGGSLLPLKRRQCMVQRGEDTLYSLELSGGPVMPHTTHSLLTLLSSSMSSFSVELTPPVDSDETVAFNHVSGPPARMAAVFGAHGLSDCGMSGAWIHTATESPSRATAAAAAASHPPRRFRYDNGTFRLS